MTVIVWAWRHHVMTARTFSDLDDAIRSARWAADDGEEAIDCIEVIRPDGTRELLDEAAVDRLMEPLDEADEARWLLPRPTPTVILDLQGPNGSWGPYCSVIEWDKATREADEWRSLLGADRVRLRAYGSANTILY